MKIPQIEEETMLRALQDVVQSPVATFNLMLMEQDAIATVIAKMTLQDVQLSKGFTLAYHAIKLQLAKDEVITKTISED